MKKKLKILFDNLHISSWLPYRENQIYTIEMNKQNYLYNNDLCKAVLFYTIITFFFFFFVLTSISF